VGETRRWLCIKELRGGALQIVGAGSQDAMEALARLIAFNDAEVWGVYVQEEVTRG